MDVDRNGTHDDTTLIRERIAETRKDLSATVEALAYKTDVPARAQDALGDAIDTSLSTARDGIDSAKETVGLASGIVSDVVAVTIDNAKTSATDVYDVAASAVATVPKSTRKRAVGLGLFAILAVAIAVVVLRRRSASTDEETTEKDG